jgi:alkylated DNA repair dioxygenase AlkB
MKILTEVPVVYDADFLQDPDTMFMILWNELPWVRHDKVPRRECYFNEFDAPYAYGKPEFARTYLPTPEWHPIVKYIQAQLEKYLDEQLDMKMRMEVCFLNGYEDGHDQLGWHADDSPEMDDDRPIVTISLGAEREIWFRRNEENAHRAFYNHVGKLYDKTTASEQEKQFYLDIRKPERLKLGNGSIAIMMPGMQDTHEHRIPKSDKHDCGPRISLTFRGYKPVA